MIISVMVKSSLVNAWKEVVIILPVLVKSSPIYAWKEVVISNGNISSGQIESDLCLEGGSNK